MKKQVRNFVLSAGFAALFSASILTAQTKLETAEISFDFHVGNNSLPAGNYVVNNLGNKAVIQLWNKDTHESAAIVPASRSTDKGRAVLGFRCYGDNCFLSEVDVPGSPAYMLSKGKQENETAKSDTKATMKYVAMNIR